MLDGNGTKLAHGAPLPLRFGTFHWGGGIVHSHWVPGATGPGWQPKSSLMPFAGALKPYTTVVTGFNHRYTTPGHIPARGVALSSSHDLARCAGTNCVGVFRGQNMPEPSLDALVAESWKGSKVRILPVKVGSDPMRGSTSWERGGFTYNRHSYEPADAFNQVFGAGAPMAGTNGGGVIQAATAYKRSMLDALLAETAAMKARLGKTDQMRLDQHFQGLRSLEQQLVNAAKPSPGAPPPATPESQTCARPALSATATKMDRAKLHAEIVATALACDMTRIFSFEWSAPASNDKYPEVGMNDPHHRLTHGAPTSDLHARVIGFIMEGYAALGEALLRRQEGAGNLLDSTLVFGTSEHANAGRHDWADHPLLFLGRAGGAFRAGIHLRQSGGEAPRVLLTAVRAVGVNVPRLGQDGGRLATEPVAELLT
jgi:hypothetical protein